MRRVVLDPTLENLLHIMKEDKLKKNQDIVGFIQILQKIDGAFNIALDGSWGTGKTFFIKQTKIVIDYLSGQYKEDYEENEQQQIENLIGEIAIAIYKLKLNSCRTVYFDAWEHDHDIDPIASLSYELALCGNGTDTTRLEAFGSLNTLLKNKLNLDLSDIIGKDNLIEHVKAEKNIKQDIEKKIDDIIGEVADRIIIFIDELDRCNPTYAVRLLERIKHYFNHEKILFVFVLNAEQLQHTIKAYYGEHFEAIQYLEKFFDLWLPMPKIEYDYYLKDMKSKIQGNLGVVSREVMRYLQLSFREIDKYIQEVNYISRQVQRIMNKTLVNDVIYGDICLFLLGLKIKDITLYAKVMAGESPETVVDFFMCDRMKEKRTYMFEFQNDDDMKEGLNLLYNMIFNNAKLTIDENYTGMFFEQLRLSDWYIINIKSRLEEILRCKQD